MTSPRRISVKRHPGVYYRELPGGKRRYEITWRAELLDAAGDVALDEEGRPRRKRYWRVVDGDLEAAGAAADAGARLEGDREPSTGGAGARLAGPARYGAVHRPAPVRAARARLVGRRLRRRLRARAQAVEPGRCSRGAEDGGVGPGRDP